MEALGEQGAPPLGGHLPRVGEQPLAVGGGGGRGEEPVRRCDKKGKKGGEREGERENERVRGR